MLLTLKEVEQCSTQNISAAYGCCMSAPLMLLKKGHCGCDHLLTERSKLVLMSLNLVMNVITVALVCAMN